MHREQRETSDPLPSRVLTILVAVTVVGFVIGLNYWMQVTLATRMTGKDFMSLWTGAKAIVLGLSPYDPTIWRPLRIAHGCNWNRDPISPWPHWTHMLFVPLSFLTPELAGAIWVTIGQLSILVGLSLITQILGCKRKWALYTLSVGSFLFRPLYPAILNGQVSPALFFGLAAAFTLISRGRPYAGGLVLALQALKPNATGFFLLTVGIAFLFRQDWSALAGLLTGGLTLLLASSILLPGWSIPWLVGAVTRKGGVGFAAPTLWGLVHNFAGSQHWPQAGFIAVGVFYAVILGFIWRYRQGSILFIGSLAVIASTLLAPYLWAYEYVLLLFPASISLFRGIDSEQGPRWAWWAGWWIVTVALSWLLLLVALRSGTGIWTAVLPLASLCYLALADLACRQSD